MKRLIAFTLLILAVTVGAQAATIAKKQAVPITVVRSLSKPLMITITAPGELESPANPIIAAEVEGQVLEVSAKGGETVETGDVLATLDPEPYEIALQSAQASVARIEALAKNQQLTVNRLQDLRRQQSSAQSDLDSAVTELAVTRAELTAAKARARDAHYQLDKATIQSPSKGVVQKRYISVGSYVRKGDPVYQIVATDTLTAHLYIPESITGRVQPGIPVELHAGGSNHRLQAVISRLRPALDPDNRALAVMVDFNNQYHWRPGSSISSRITLEQLQDAVMVPVMSVVRRPAGNVVYRIDNGKAVAQPVELGTREGSEVRITSGLPADTPIALDGAGFLNDGVAVEIRERKE